MRNIKAKRNRVFHRSCGRKKKFSSKDEVAEAADKIYLDRKVVLSWYLCTFCFGWHLTKREGN
jgi:hypothetical protein